MNIMDYNLFKSFENLEGSALFFAIAKSIYWAIMILAIIFGVFKVFEACYQFTKKSGNAPAYALVEHKQEIWEYIRGVVFLVVGLTVLGILVRLGISAGWFSF